MPSSLSQSQQSYLPGSSVPLSFFRPADDYRHFSQPRPRLFCCTHLDFHMIVELKIRSLASKTGLCARIPPPSKEPGQSSWREDTDLDAFVSFDDFRFGDVLHGVRTSARQTRKPTISPKFPPTLQPHVPPTCSGGPPSAPGDYDAQNCRQYQTLAGVATLCTAAAAPPAPSAWFHFRSMSLPVRDCYIPHC